MTKRILLTGAAGFIGSHVLRHVLTETDYELVLPVTFRHRGNGDRIASAIANNREWHERVDVVICDLSAPISATTRHRFGHIDEIWNIASDSSVDRSIENPISFIQNNTNLMLYLLDYARDIQPKLFLHMSTDEVFGPAHDDYRHHEWDRILPSNPYSASKAAQEAIAISYWRTYGLNVVITNTMNLFGELQDPEKMVPKTIRSIMNGEEVTVHTDSSGIPGSRFYLHCRNLADAWLWISENQTVQKYPTFDTPLRYNIVGDREMDNISMVKLIGEIMGVTPKIKRVDFHAARPGHDRRYALDGTKLAEAGWEAPVPFEESLRRVVEWTVAHPEWLK
jgi:dTDP-glucose 4,6-dehydratase